MRREGSSVVAAVMVLLVLSSLGLLLSAQVAGDQLVAANQIEACARTLRGRSGPRTCNPLPGRQSRPGAACRRRGCRWVRRGSR